jgi:hypothetical protein
VVRLRDSQPDTAVGYFYFDFNDAEKRVSSMAIRSLLFQFAQHKGEGLQSLQQLYQRCGNGQQQPSKDTIQLFLLDTIRAIGVNFIVLDALEAFSRSQSQDRANAQMGNGELYNNTLSD